MFICEVCSNKKSEVKEYKNKYVCFECFSELYDEVTFEDERVCERFVEKKWIELEDLVVTPQYPSCLISLLEEMENIK